MAIVQIPTGVVRGRLELAKKKEFPVAFSPKDRRLGLLDAYTAETFEASAHFFYRSSLGRLVLDDTTLADMFPACLKLRLD